MKEKITLTITGMHCTSCAVSVDLELEDIEGINSSDTNYAKQQTTIDFDPSKVTLEKIISTIQSLGYIATTI